MKKIIYLLVLFALCSVALRAQDDDLVLGKKTLEHEYVKAVFNDSPFSIQESFITSPNSKTIYALGSAVKYLMPYEFNLFLHSKHHVLVSNDTANIIRLYLYLSFYNGQKPESKIVVTREDNNLTGIAYNYKAMVEYKDKNYEIFIRYSDQQIERIDYFCDDLKIGFKIPLHADTGKTDPELEADIPAITVTPADVASEQYFSTGAEYSQMVYNYLTVTENDVPTNAKFNIHLNNLDVTNYYMYSIIVRSMTGVVYDRKEDLYSENGVIDFAFEPERYETGICEVILYRRNAYEEEYKYLKSFDAVCLVPEHKITRDIPLNQGYQDPNTNDYTIYYTDDFFKTVEEISISDYLTNLEKSYVDAWEKAVNQYQMCEGVTYTTADEETVINKPIDMNKNIEIAVYDGDTPYHGIGKDNGYDGTAFTYRSYGRCIMYMPTTMREPDGYKPEYIDDYDAIATSVAEAFHHFVMHSWKEANHYAPNWLYNAQAAAMQSIITQEFNSEFKIPQTQYPIIVNSFLKNMDTPLYPDRYQGDYYDTKERFALYWRSIFENSVPEGSEKDRLKMFKTLYEKVPISGSFENMRRTLTGAFEAVPNGIYKSLNQSFVAFTEKLMYIDPALGNWGRWYQSQDMVYNMPKYEKGISWVFNNQYDGQIRGMINNTYGIKLHSLSMSDIKKVLETGDFNIEFAGNDDAQWGVVVSLLATSKLSNQALSFVMPLEKSVSNYTGTVKVRKTLINQAGYDYEIQEIRIGVVRLDTKTDAQSDYSINIRRDNSTIMAVLSPLAEYPLVVNTANTLDLKTTFTVLGENGVFVPNFLDGKVLNVSLKNQSYDIKLTTNSTSTENKMYLANCTIPSDIPTGYYDLVLEAVNNSGTTKAVSATSVYIKNDYGCSGQIITLNSWYNTSSRPQLILEDKNLLTKSHPAATEIKFGVVVIDDNNDKLIDPKLRCRRLGEEGYFFFDLTWKSNKLYEAIIPDSIVNYPIVDFYITATTKKGYAVSLPEFEPQTYPLHLAVADNVIPYLEVTKVPVLTLLSLEQPLVFGVKAADETNEVQRVGFKYRTEGELVWQEEIKVLPAGTKDTNLVFEIPAGFSGLKSIEYSFYAYDNFGVRNEIGSDVHPIYVDFLMPAPLLISPANNAKVMDYKFDLVWQDLSQLYYELANKYLYQVQIATDVNFTEIIVDSLVDLAYINDVPLEYGLTYHWRVLAKVDDFTTGWSTAFQFTTVRPIPDITKLDYLEKICVGEMLYLGVETNAGIWNYEWYKDGKLIENSNSPVFIIDSAQLKDSGVYYCIVRSLLDVDFVRTKDINVRVYDQPYIVKSPVTQYVKPSYKATFKLKIDALGFAPDGVPRIEWYRGGQLLNDMDRVVMDYEDSTDTYRMFIYDVTEMDYSKEYYVIIYGRCDEFKKVISEKFALQPYFDPTTVKIVTQPKAQEICADEEVRLLVESQIVGHGTITYKWYRNGNPINDDAFYFGTNTKEMIIKNFDNVRAGDFKCKISIMPDETFVFSDQVNVKIYEKPFILSQSIGTENAQIGETVSLFVNASGDHLKFFWFKDKDSEFYCTTQTLVIPNYTADDAGNYTCMVYNQCDTVLSVPVTLETGSGINDEPNAFNARITPNPVSTVCTLNFNVSETGLINIVLYSSTGQVVSTLANSTFVEGTHNLTIDTGILDIASGTYFVLIQTGDKFITLPFVILQ
ncbi:MAG: immunoglobulin domain-containing protein [bacterium]